MNASLLLGACKCGRVYRMSVAYAQELRAKGVKHVPGKCIQCSGRIAFYRATDDSWNLRSLPAERPPVDGAARLG
jgi:hypothetical protein